jgi:hypothetical protein
MTSSPAGYRDGMSDPHVEEPEDKDLQDHRFGAISAAQQEAADRGTKPAKTGEPEPHAGGKA